MAKTTTDKTEGGPAATAAPLKFRDLLYTSRVLIIPKTERTLAVSKGHVEVQADDAEALAYLTDHQEFARKE